MFDTLDFPIYPTWAPLPAGACPDGYVRIIGATGWTCATPDQYDQLMQYRWKGLV